MDEEMVLCAASSYEQKYYLNPEFESLPEAVKQELQIMCVLYTAEVKDKLKITPVKKVRDVLKLLLG